MKTLDQILAKHSINPAELEKLQAEIRQEIADYNRQETAGIPHDCPEHNPLCFRCDLNLDEIEEEEE